MSLQIANLEVAEGCFSCPWDPKLIQLYIWFAARYNHATITCAFEQRDYPSVHSMKPLRGLDMRSRHYANPKIVRDDINRHWAYDPTRPELKCCVFGDGDHLDHFHLQCHPNTIRR